MLKINKELGKVTISENNEHVALKEDAIEAFSELGSLQRGKPEAAMMKYSMDVGTGVMANAMEHMGDMIHRATHHAKHGSLYRGYVQEKAEKILRSLRSGYGFDREHQENLESNASFNEKNLQAVQQQSALMMKNYAYEHGQLPAYNEFHQLCKDACVQLGLGKTAESANILEEILSISNDKEKFNEMAGTVYRNEKGDIVSYDIVKELEAENESGMVY